MRAGKTPLFIGIGVAATIATGAFLMFGGKKEAKQSGPLSPLSGTSAGDALKPAQGTARTTVSTPIKVSEDPKREFRRCWGGASDYPQDLLDLKMKIAPSK